MNTLKQLLKDTKVTAPSIDKKSAKRKAEIMAELETGYISKSTIGKLLKAFNGTSDVLNAADLEEIMFYIGENSIRITEEQTEQGLTFLRKYAKSKHSTLSYSENEVLANFEHFTLDGFYNAGNIYRSFFVPLYSACSKDNSFQYYYANGVVNVTL